jgi:hypothetical protein
MVWGGVVMDKPPGIKEWELVGTQGNSGELRRKSFSRTEEITDIKEGKLSELEGTQEGDDSSEFP